MFKLIKEVSDQFKRSLKDELLGDADKMCPLEEGKKLADHIKGSEVQVINNCGHMMLLEEADQTLEILKSFIGKHYPLKK